MNFFELFGLPIAFKADLTQLRAAFMNIQRASHPDKFIQGTEAEQELALEILRLAKEKNVQIHIPVDVVAADAFANDANTQIVDVREIPNGWQGLDAGPKSLENFKKVIMDSKTILWNGPLGVFEMETFAKGTITLGNFIAESTANGAFSLVGGGDSVAAVKQFGLEDKMSYVSTGGGAMLEMLEGRVLPGIAAILD